MTDDIMARPDGTGGEGVPAGMKAYGPDHPDYPNPPRDQARLGLPVRRSGANAVGLDWKHHAPDHHRYPSDIVAYWPDDPLAASSSSDARSTTFPGGEGTREDIARIIRECHRTHVRQPLFSNEPRRTFHQGEYDAADAIRAVLATTSSPDAPRTSTPAS